MEEEINEQLQSFTIDEWRAQFLEFSDTFLSGYSKKVHKGDVNFVSFGPFLFCFDLGEELYTFDIQGLVGFYQKVTTKSFTSKDSLKIAGEEFYLAEYASNRFMFVSAEGLSFIIYGNFENDETIVCTLKSDLGIQKMKILRMLIRVHEMFNSAKVKNNAEGKFLIKTIKPR